MTPEQAKTLRFFKWSEFRHPELFDYSFAVFIDQVRYEYGWPIVLTNDARTPAENEALRSQGSAPNSRHLAGQAIDMEFPPSSNHLWRLVEAVMKVAGERPIELELVNSSVDTHVHIAFLEPGRASKLLVKAD
jgi:peptidase M15-like protein